MSNYIKEASYNVNGLLNPVKRSKILTKLKEKIEIALLQETRAVTIHQTHDSVRITIFDPRFGSYHDFFVGGGRKKKKYF